jgi:hypothetical protein
MWAVCVRDILYCIYCALFCQLANTQQLHHVTVPPCHEITRLRAEVWINLLVAQEAHILWRQGLRRRRDGNP